MTYTCKIEEHYEFETLITLAISKKLNICNIYRKEGWKDWPYVKFSPDDTYLGDNVYGSKSSQGTVVNFIELLQLMCEGDKNRLELTEEYTAVLDRENRVVKVGCQNIPFSKVEDLYKLINKK